MERLTYDFALGGNHCWQVKGADNLECREVCERQGDDGCKTCPIAKAFDRLAAYEETGLEPEEIKAIAGLASENCAKTADAIDKLLQDDAELKSYRELGSIDRLRELAKADRMIGKEVWAQSKYLNIFQTKPSIIQRTTIQYISLLKGGDILCHTQTCAFPLNEIGKTVFSTRAEAEEALRREQDEQIKP